MKEKTNKPQENSTLSMFEVALMDAIKEWREEGIDPLEDLQMLTEYANELLSVVIDPIPSWSKIRNADQVSFENGLLETPKGTALIHDGWFVMLEDLVERLPRIVEG